MVALGVIYKQSLYEDEALDGSGISLMLTGSKARNE
jgi:hypothetical protein